MFYIAKLFKGFYRKPRLTYIQHFAGNIYTTRVWHTLVIFHFNLEPCDYTVINYNYDNSIIILLVF